jgi:phytoene dehydrogenase-like protein
MGGLGRLAEVLVDAAKAGGVALHPGVDVAAVVTGGERVGGVRLAGGEVVKADVVVANADAEHLYRELLPDDRALARVRRAEPSTSGVAVLVAVDGTTPDVGHHNVWFSADARREFEQLARHELPDDPTIYACMPTATDPATAPPGAESWFLLVNAPAGWAGDAAAAAACLLAALADRGVDLRSRLRWTEVVAPADLAARYRAPGGAIYGSSSNGRRAAFLRPPNRGARRGLYLVGGSTHPGGGLPLVAISARIVAAMVEADGW